MSASPRWRAPPAIRASVVLHGAALAGIALAPAHWPWAVGTIAANHLLLAGAGFAPRSTLIGDTVWRLPRDAAARGELALTFDDGPDTELTPRVLDALAAAGARATFFCVGERVLRDAALARRIVDAGHEIGNHSHRHSTAFAWSGPRTLAREVDDAQRAIADATGIVPRLFRAPFGIRTPLLDPVLAARGLRHVTWSARGFDTVAAGAGRVLSRLETGLRPGAVLLLHDGRATGVRAGVPASWAADVLPMLLEAMTARGLKSVGVGETLARTGAVDAATAVHAAERAPVPDPAVRRVR